VLLIKKGGFRLDSAAVALLLILVAVNLVVTMFNDTGFINFMFGLSTHGFIFLLAVRNRSEVNVNNMYLWLSGCLLLAFYQAGLGFIQLMSYGFPLKLPYRDFTEDFLQGSFGSGGNRFAANLIIIAISIYIFKFRQGIEAKKLPLLFLFFMLILSSSNMSLVSMILTFFLIYLFPPVKNMGGFGRAHGVRKGLDKKSIYIAFFMVFGVFGFVLIGGDYFVDTYYKWTTELEYTDNARVMGILNTINALPSMAPYQPFVGVGLGGYSSWAQLLLSEDYLYRHVMGKHSSMDLSWLVSESDLSYSNILKYLSEDYFRPETESIINQPFFSWQSLYAEIGGYGLLTLFVLLTPKIRLLRVFGDDDVNVRLFKQVLIFNGIFLLINGFLDNYFEYVWMTVPFLVGLIMLPEKTINKRLI